MWRAWARLLLFCTLLAACLAVRPLDEPIVVDCGAETSLGGQQYQAGKLTLLTSGTAASIQGGEALGLSKEESSMRVFEPTGGCYNMTQPAGRYTLRMGFAYHNYDGRNQYPAFKVLVQGVWVDQISLARIEGSTAVGAMLEKLGVPRAIHYAEYSTVLGESGTSSADVSVCLMSLDATPPILNILVLIPEDSGAFGELGSLSLKPSQFVLSLKHRLNFGGDVIRSSDSLGFRTWTGVPKAGGIGGHRVMKKLLHQIQGADVAPEYLPSLVFQSAWEGAAGDTIDLSNQTFIALPFFQRSPSHPMLARIYLCELSRKVPAGARVFNITFGAPVPGSTNWVPFIWDTNQRNVDIMASAPAPYTAHFLSQLGCIPSMLCPAQGDLALLYFVFSALPGLSQHPPLVNGVELYELIPRTPASAAALSCSPSDADLLSSSPAALDGSDSGNAGFVGIRISDLSVAAVVGIVIVSNVAVVLLSMLIYYITFKYMGSFKYQPLRSTALPPKDNE